MKFYIDQHGCAKNQVDGEEIAARLEDSGHEYVASAEAADLVIVNSCGFIESAKRESIEATIAIKSRWPGKKVLLAGCLAQRYPEALLGDMAEADGIFGNADLSLAVDAAQKTFEGDREAIVPAQPDTIGGNYYSRRRLFDFPGSTYVKVTEGCDNCCTYCAIPLIRGRLRSRGVEDIVDECRSLIGRGIREINLIGQDLGAYGRDLAEGGGRAPGLADLLAALSALEGDFRVRTLYIHPDHFPEGILEVMAKDRRILPYFDLPLQHASERVLKAMNRKGSPRVYLDLIAKIRASLDDAMIRSTFLVGFPGETDEDFETLRRFQDEAKLDWLGVFTYSREENTPAYGMKGRVAKKVAEGRKASIEAAQEAITGERLQRFIGRTVEVLAEEGVEGEALTLGRAWMQAPDVDGLTVVKGRFAPGTICQARVVGVNGVDLEAEPLGNEA
ncbi:30S ribosomal protein S12 methylthiotransferase RimO [bacterium]|nr:30S ribosomal protein S12 methylthiotransferase RimO [bacterium]